MSRQQSDIVWPLITNSTCAVCLELQEMFAQHVDGSQLITALEAEREFVMTPKMFMHTINRICLQQVRLSQAHVL